MLVLSRKRQESVFVGRLDSGEPTLSVTVLEIIGTRVKLGFAAAADVPVLRGELWARIHGNGGVDEPTSGPAVQSA